MNGDRPEERQFVPPQQAVLEIINAHALEPGKIYLFEVDRAKVSEEQLRGALDYLGRRGIDGVIVRSIGGDGIKVVGLVTDHAPVRWMVEIGVEGHRFHPHIYNPHACPTSGCLEARPEEIPK